MSLSRLPVFARRITTFSQLMNMRILSDYSTCEISDALVKLNVPSGGHLPDIYRITTPPRASDGRSSTLCGPAYTVKMVLGSDKESPTLTSHFIDTVEPHSVIVIDAPPGAKNAVWGGLMTAGAQARGAQGVVISGRCRDLDEQEASGFPVFARAHSTVGQSPFTRPSAVQVPLVIAPQPDGSDFPSTTIEPGDIVVGDRDGVVVVPQNLAFEVIALVQRGHGIDQLCLTDIKAGLGVQATFKKHRG